MRGEATWTWHIKSSLKCMSYLMPTALELLDWYIENYKKRHL